MAYKLTKGINSLTEYNLGGISHIWLLNIDDFITYKFKDDDLYSSSYVDAIYKEDLFLKLGSIEESNFKESLTNGIYKQEISTYIRTLRSDILNRLNYAIHGKYLVVVRTMHNKYFTFGSDGGATLSYSGQASRQLGEPNGVMIKLEKNSIYPMFEAHPDAIKTRVLGSDFMSCIITEQSDITNINYIIEIL